jgi:hypothetical protein
VEYYVDPETQEKELWQLHVERSTDGGENPALVPISRASAPTPP